MSTLFDAMLETSRLTGVLASGVTTGQLNADYFYDNKRWETDGYFNNGTVFILSGTVNLNETRRVIEFRNVDGRFYCDTFDDVIVEGTQYAVVNANRGQLVHAVNSALIYMGNYLDFDESLTFVNESSELELPDGVSNVMRIEIKADEAPTARYFRVTNWKEVGGKIKLPAPLYFESGMPIRYYYLKQHPRVFDDDDQILEPYNFKRLIWTAAYMFLLDRMQYAGNSDEKENYLLQNAMQTMNKLEVQFPVYQGGRDSNLAVY